MNAAALAAREPAVELDVPARHDGLRGALGVHPGLLFVLGGMLGLPLVLSRYWVFNVTVGLVLGIACLGLLVLGWVRDISLAQAGLTGTALLLTYYFLAGPPAAGKPRWGMPFPVAAACATAVVVTISVVVALVGARLAGAYLAVLTLSLQFLLENTVMTSEALTGCLCEPTTPRPPFFGVDLRDDRHFYYLVVGAVVVSMGFVHRLRVSRPGRSMLMAGSDPRAAAAVGINPWKCRVGAFAVAGLFAGIAGALSSPLFFSPPGTLQYISFNSVFYLAIPVLAGFESTTAVVAVAVVFTLIPQLFLDAKLNVYLLGGVGMAIGVLLGPRGLCGGVTALLDRRRTHAGGPPWMPPIPRYRDPIRRCPPARSPAWPR